MNCFFFSIAETFQFYQPNYSIKRSFGIRTKVLSLKGLEYDDDLIKNFYDFTRRNFLSIVISREYFGILIKESYKKEKMIFFC